MKVLNECEAYYTACRMEEGAVSLYGRALQVMDLLGRGGEPLYSLLKNMREEECTHLCRFRAMAGDTVPEDERRVQLDAQAEAMLFEGGLMGAARAGMLDSPEKMLNIARKAEALSAEHYREFARLAKDASAQEALLSIAEQEEEHLGDLLRFSPENGLG